MNREDPKKQLEMSTAEFHLLYGYRMKQVEEDIKDLKKWCWRLILIGSVSLALLGKDHLWKFIIP